MISAYRVAKNTIKKVFLNGVLVYDRTKDYLGNRKLIKPTPDLWDMDTDAKGHLIIQKCSVGDLVKKYDTPLYIVDKQRLEKNYFEFLNNFQKFYPNIDIAYSYKTNPLPGAIKTLHEVGASSEVISPFELWLALKIGVSPDKIIYNGPGKSEKSLKTAIDKKIHLINIDGPTEIDIIRKISSQNSYKQQVGVRVITSVGWSSQFGFRIDNGAALNAFRDLQGISNVIPCCLHLHLGTGLKDIDMYVQAIKEVLDFAEMLKEELKVAINYFDFGGGFGVPTVNEYTPIDTKLMANNMPPRNSFNLNESKFKNYCSTVTELFQKYYKKESQNLPVIIFEPGRAITSSAQTLVLKVLAIKPGDNGKYNLILDGGVNIAMPTTWERHVLFPALKMDRPYDRSYSVFGPLCHPHDLLYNHIELPEIQLGDILAIMDAGAYFIPNQMNFSFPRPSAILVHNGVHKLIRERECFEDIVALDKW